MPRRTTIGIALVIVGCTTRAEFFAACDAVHRGMSRADVDAQLSAVGGRHGFVGESDTWQLESLFSNYVCEVDFDAHDRVQASYSRDWSD